MAHLVPQGGDTSKPLSRLRLLTDNTGNVYSLVLLINQATCHASTGKGRWRLWALPRKQVTLSTLFFMTQHMYDQSLGEQLKELVPSKAKSWIFGDILSGVERTDMENRAGPLIKALFEKTRRLYAQVIVWSSSHPCR